MSFQPFPLHVVDLDAAHDRRRLRRRVGVRAAVWCTTASLIAGAIERLRAHDLLVGAPAGARRRSPASRPAPSVRVGRRRHARPELVGAQPAHVAARPELHARRRRRSSRGCRRASAPVPPSGATSASAAPSASSRRAGGARGSDTVPGPVQWTPSMLKCTAGSPRRARVPERHVLRRAWRRRPRARARERRAPRARQARTSLQNALRATVPRRLAHVDPVRINPYTVKRLLLAAPAAQASRRRRAAAGPRDPLRART